MNVDYDSNECSNEFYGEFKESWHLTRSESSSRGRRQHDVKALSDNRAARCMRFEVAGPAGAATLEVSDSQYILKRILRRI